MARRQNNHHAAKIFLFLGCLILVLTSVAWHCPKAEAASKKFPHYPTIKSNVQFWEKIYSTYSLNQAVIHDSDDLSIVYAVIPLLDKSVPGAHSKNSSTEKSARKKYSAILRKLSQRPATNREEIRIAALFSGKNSRKTMASAAKNVRSQKGVKERFMEGVQSILLLISHDCFFRFGAKTAVDGTRVKSQNLQPPLQGFNEVAF